ncbi:DUF1552 domain-containing protein [Myxococcus sp. CA051A]|uniref:DUF1552 domain-containing protein n=1 Tax=unclassified Myxococcus TaxID=2648731 RepID=UPI00157AA29F|nr:MULTISPECIES: DUF1552 domain-containing protein [unclassified Myxococcus]NTX33416.1 DUF1552 domain-containing protein [Myxococcus sp. CA033]NTX57080.1 DUF1552 domain-containing protein [Myxococcus sp. CA039A]NTX59476.1 DUF1552 domain-containing protein [Myxococcus sp. CA051A]
MLRELSRRSLIKTLAGSAAALPLANLLGTTDAYAQGTTPPMRFIAIFTSHGCLPEYWSPKGGELDFNLDFPNSMLAPLQRHRSKLLVLDGLDYQVLYEHGLTGHEGGPVTFLTGSKVNTASGDDLPENASLDQVLAAQIGGATRFRSLQLNAWEQFGGQHVYNSISFTPNGGRVPFERDPAGVYQRLFGAAPSPTSDPGENARTLARRKSLLDYLVKDATRLRNRLAGAERQKLETHLESLRDIERRLGSLSTAPAPSQEPVPAEAACSGGAAPPAFDLGQLGNLENMPTLTKLHMDLIVRAFACDLTRVVTMTIPGPSMPWLGIHEDTHNDLAHRLDVTDEPLRSQIRGKMVQVQRWYAEQVAYLMDGLASVQEGSGTALDNTLILWGNELGDASGHMNVRVPTVLAGGAAGKFRMGRFLRLRPEGSDPLSGWSGPGTPMPDAVAHNKLLVSIAQAFGVNVNTFGHPDFKGPLSGLT